MKFYIYVLFHIDAGEEFDQLFSMGPGFNLLLLFFPFFSFWYFCFSAYFFPGSVVAVCLLYTAKMNY